MCTCATYSTVNHYFGRNLDLEYSYHEEVTIAPRNFPFVFRHAQTLENHYAIIGMAYIANGYPLYYDACNEQGLAMAGLNFPVNSDFKEYAEDKDNITPFEIIPWVLGQCNDLSEARTLLTKVNLLKENFSEQLPLNPLHWMIGDKSGKSIVMECTKDGLHIYDNPVGVMTNNPTFDIQMFKLNDYGHVNNGQGNHTFGDVSLDSYSRGMGSIGVPGDLSSSGRFVKAAFTRNYSVSPTDEMSSVSQFFHILGSVDQQRGCCKLSDSAYEITIYSSCMNLEEGIYYYRTYDNSQISAVCMHHEDINGKELVAYELCKEQAVNYQN